MQPSESGMLADALHPQATTNKASMGPGLKPMVHVGECLCALQALEFDGQMSQAAFSIAFTYYDTTVRTDSFTARSTRPTLYMYR